MPVARPIRAASCSGSVKAAASRLYSFFDITKIRLQANPKPVTCGWLITNLCALLIGRKIRPLATVFLKAGRRQPGVYKPMINARAVIDAARRKSVAALGDRRGVTALEYGVLAGGIIAVIAAIIITIGSNLNAMFTSISGQI
jgi:pilus assembly protein Flp/PilA